MMVQDSSGEGVRESRFGPWLCDRHFWLFSSQQQRPRDQPFDFRHFAHTLLRFSRHHTHEIVLLHSNGKLFSYTSNHRRRHG